jgi:tetratricopeptide (TPR) repeat protein
MNRILNPKGEYTKLPEKNSRRGRKGEISLLFFLLLLFSSCATTQPEKLALKSRERYEKAIHYLKKEDWESARTTLIESVELNPRNAPARNLLGVLFYLEGDYTSAVTQFLWATESDPSNPAYYYNLALSYIRSGLPGFALPPLNRALEQKGDHPQISRLLFHVYILLQRWTQAEKWEKNLLSFDEWKKDPYVTWERGILSLAKEEYDKALTLFTLANNLGVPTYMTLFAYGVTYKLLGYPSLATTYLTKAMEENPRDPYLGLSLAETYLLYGQLNKAHKILSSIPLTSVSQNDTIWAYKVVSDLKYQLGFYPEIPYYTDLLKKVGGEEKVLLPETIPHYRLGYQAMMSGDYDRAISEFSLSVSASPRFVLGWLRLTEAYLERALGTRKEERETFLNSALRSAWKVQDLDPREPYGYFLTGKALVALSQLKEEPYRSSLLREALFTFSKIQVTTSIEYLPEYQGLILLALGKPEVAEGFFTTPSTPHTRRWVEYGKILALIEKGEYGKAEELLTRYGEQYRTEEENWLKNYLRYKSIQKKGK